MTAAAFIAAIPEPYQILGLRLKPFCLGHFIHMARHDVAFVSDTPKEAELSDLILGVLICSMNYEDFMTWLYSADVEAEMKEWGKKSKQFDFEAKVALLRSYITEGSKQPTVFYERNGEPSGAHWTQVLKLALVELGHDESGALNMPLGKAFEDYFKFAENKGAVRIATPEQCAQIEAFESAQKEASCPVPA